MRPLTQAGFDLTHSKSRAWGLAMKNASGDLKKIACYITKKAMTKGGLRR